MTTLKNDRLIRALLRQPVDHTPVWLMRQAGRYLPEYRQLRQQVPHFMQFCRTPELACEATMQPLARYDLDAAIVFSDILVVPQAMGCDVHFVQNEGPKIDCPIRSLQDVQNLQQPDVEQELGYVMQTIKLVTSELNSKLPLIGFAGSPWTVATYMVEGGSSKLFHTIKRMLYCEPDLLQQLLEKITHTTIAYLNAQVAAGANALMVFDTWGGVLSSADYVQFSLLYLRKIARQVTRQHNGQTIPLIFFTKNGGQWLESMADSGCDALGLDWTTDLGQARRRVGDRVALQGNLDPMVLFAQPSIIKSQVQRILQSYGSGTGHVFNLGHGIDKDTPPQSVAALIEAVHEHFAVNI